MYRFLFLLYILSFVCFNTMPYPVQGFKFLKKGKEIWKKHGKKKKKKNKPWSKSTKLGAKVIAVAGAVPTLDIVSSFILPNKTHASTYIKRLVTGQPLHGNTKQEDESDNSEQINHQQQYMLTPSSGAFAPRTAVMTPNVLVRELPICRLIISETDCIRQRFDLCQWVAGLCLPNCKKYPGMDRDCANDRFNLTRLNFNECSRLQTQPHLAKNQFLKYGYDFVDTDISVKNDEFRCDVVVMESDKLTPYEKTLPAISKYIDFEDMMNAAKSGRTEDMSPPLTVTSRRPGVWKLHFKKGTFLYVPPPPKSDYKAFEFHVSKDQVRPLCPKCIVEVNHITRGKKYAVKICPPGSVIVSINDHDYYCKKSKYDEDIDIEVGMAEASDIQLMQDQLTQVVVGTTTKPLTFELFKAAFVGFDEKQ